MSYDDHEGIVEHDLERSQEEIARLTAEVDAFKDRLSALCGAFAPVLHWYDGDGEQLNLVKLLPLAVADLQHDRKEVERLTAKQKRISGLCTNYHRWSEGWTGEVEEVLTDGQKAQKALTEIYHIIEEEE